MPENPGLAPPPRRVAGRPFVIAGTSVVDAERDHDSPANRDAPMRYRPMSFGRRQPRASLRESCLNVFRFVFRSSLGMQD
jgi:hypothetical protein